MTELSKQQISAKKLERSISWLEKYRKLWKNCDRAVTRAAKEIEGFDL